MKHPLFILHLNLHHCLYETSLTWQIESNGEARQAFLTNLSYARSRGLCLKENEKVYPNVTSLQRVVQTHHLPCS